MKDAKQNAYWYLFEETGDIEAYLLYRNYQKEHNEEYASDSKEEIYGGKSDGNSNP